MNKMFALIALAFATSAAAALPIWNTTGPATFGDIWLASVSVLAGLGGLGGIFAFLVAEYC